MISKFIITWLLSCLCFETRAGYSSQYSKETSDDSECIFDTYRETYNVTDLLRCMNEFAEDLFVSNDDSALKRTDQLDASAYKEDSYNFPYADIILNLFKITSSNNDASSTYNYPSNPATNNYPLNYPNALFGQFGGLQGNIFNALSSIARYDDLKCVPRILCEMTSGNPPGTYRQALTENNKYLGKSEGNVFNNWVLALLFDTSMLTFVQAAMLGYRNSGNPEPCYREFPRCPRNPDKLVHYLNNHNGGFFRFFNKSGRRSYSESSYASQDNSEFLRRRPLKAPPPGGRIEADRTGTGKLQFDIPVSTAHHGTNFFPKENTPKSSGQVVFSDHVKSDDNPKSKISKSLSDLQASDVIINSQESPSFFPQELEDQNNRVLRFIPELSDSDSGNTFRFPR